MGDALHAAFHQTGALAYTRLHRVIWVLIVVSVGLVVVDLYLQTRGSGLPEWPALDLLDRALLRLFTLEVILRIVSYRPPDLQLFRYPAHTRILRAFWGRFLFCLQPMILVDIITVAALVPALRGLRALRLLRLLRTRSLFRYNDPLQGVIRAFEDNAVLYGAAFSLLAGTTLLGGLSIFLVEGGGKGAVETLPQGIWWTLVTITTVGYGDVTPETLLGRIIAGAVMIVGMFTLALFAGIIGHTMLNAVMSIREEQFRMSTYTHHIIICGYDAGARMLLDTIEREIGETRAEVVIFAEGERTRDVPPRFTWVSGDPSKESELSKVRLTHATAVVIVGPRDVKPQAADAQTILTAFTIRAFLAKARKTELRMRPLYVVAEILDAENVAHARAAGVDEVIETTRLGFSLLAHAVNDPGTASILSKLAVLGEHNLYVGELPKGVSLPMTFSEMALALKEQHGVLLIGLRHRGSLRDEVNPGQDRQVGREHQLIYLARRHMLPRT